jgi:nicotinate-nucleotide adenylyltransferase
MRIGLFGGTFNPVHRGHLHIGHEIGTAFPLDRICLIPCANPPHKTSYGLASAHDRLKMIQLALSGCKWFHVSEVELRRFGPSYSIDTVKHFLSQGCLQDQFFMLIGLDAFLELDSWKNYLQILRRVPLIILPRPVLDDDMTTDGSRQTQDFIHTKLSQRYYFDSSQLAYLHPFLKPIYTAMKLLPLNISSSKVRKQVASGKPIDALVPQKVAEYIKNKGLYR